MKASLLIALYSVTSERAFCEELDYNLLFCWFLGMQLMERSFDPTVFTKNQQRLMERQVGQQLFDEIGFGGAPAKPAVGRALHGGRHGDRGGCEPQELQAARRRPAPGTTTGAAPRWGAARQRHRPPRPHNQGLRGRSSRHRPRVGALHRPSHYPDNASLSHIAVMPAAPTSPRTLFFRSLLGREYQT